MKKCLYVILFVFTVFSLAIAQSRAQFDNIAFIENFDGTTLDTAKWNALQSSSYSGYPAYGSSIKLTNGYLDLSSNGPGFPFIYTAANPFPTSGDFEIELAMQYTCIADYGSGVQISNAGSNLDTDWQKYELVKIEAGDIGNIDDQTNAIWVSFFGSQAYQVTVQGFKPTSSAHVYRITYINGTYSLYVDDLFVKEKQSFERPNTIVLGNGPTSGIPRSPEDWAQWSYWGWTSFKIDYVKISKVGANPLTFDLGVIPISTLIVIVVVLLVGIGLGYFISVKHRKN